MTESDSFFKKTAQKENSLIKLNLFVFAIEQVDLYESHT